MRVTGVRNNKQPGDLEAREGAHVTVLPSPTRGTSRRTVTKRTIPGIRSGLVTSAEAWKPVNPAEEWEHGDLERRRESICDSTPSPARSSSCRTPTKGTIPGIRSGLIASAEAQKPDEPATPRLLWPRHGNLFTQLRHWSLSSPPRHGSLSRQLRHESLSNPLRNGSLSIPLR